ncbi:MAG: hypothetical protein KAT70_10020 [Thermoplasmata archaeon]|nr:hypothetical protein [Thermoplasmata archaeon]
MSSLPHIVKNILYWHVMSCTIEVQKEFYDTRKMRLERALEKLKRCWH